MGLWGFHDNRPASPSPSASSFSSKSSAKNAVKTTLILLERVAEASNIPALKGSVGAVLEVIKIAEKRQHNKEALDELVIYLRRLEDAMITPLLSKQSLGVSPELEGRVRRLAGELVTLANDWNTLRTSHRRFLSFINHEDYTTEIRRLNKLIKDSLDAFSLDNQIAGAIVVEDIQRNVVRTVKHLVGKDIQDLPRVKASYDSISRNNAPTCFEGTRVKVFEDIGSWTNCEEGPNGYALVGVAGVGKTTVAQTLAEREAKKGRLAATYFFSRDEDERSKADSFFCTIAYQLAQCNQEFADRISEALRRSPDAPSKNLAGQLTKLIVEPLQNLRLSTPHPILIVLDALDECEEQGASEILQLLLDRLPFFKVFITTRPEPHILAVLNSRDQHERLILHEVDNAIVEGDIRRYLEHQLSEKEIQKEVPGCTWLLEEEDLNAIVEAAGRLFIVASTADKFIKDKIQGDPQYQLKVLLGGLEMGDGSDLSPYTMLDRLYTQVLETAIPQSHSTRNIIKRFQDVIGTIVVLQNPLPATVLARLLSTDRGSVDAVLRRLQSIIVSSKEDDCPRMYHPSFPDFVTTPSRCKQPRFLVEPSKHHGRLANHCFGLMKRMLKRNICQISSPNRYLKNNEIPGLASAVEKHVPPELVYACSYWAVHLSNAEPDTGGLLGQLESFAFQHLLFWLEVLSLTGNLKLAHSALVLAQKFSTSQSASAKLLSILTDGQRFIMASHEIIKASALHLYYSALPFIPSKTTLFQTYKEEAMYSIRALQGQRTNWDPLLAVLAGHTGHISSVAFTSDGLRLASSSTDGTIRMWDGVAGAHIATLEGDSSWVWCAAFTLDGKRLASGSEDGAVRLWNGRTGAPIVTLKGHGGSVKCVAFAPDGERLASGSSDMTVRLWGGVVGTSISTLRRHSGTVNSVAFASHGQLASGSDDNTIILWNLTNATPIATLRSHFDSVNSVAFSPDGKRLASGSNDTTVKLWNVTNLTLLATLSSHSADVISVAFTPDGAHLASGSWDHAIKLWNAVTGAHQMTLKGHSAGIYSVAFSSDGSRLASGSGDNTVRLWDYAVRRPMDVREGHLDMVYTLAITSDGSRLASGSLDQTVKLWDVATGALIGTLCGHSGDVNSVAFTYDGTCLASGSGDKTVKLWDGASEELISTLVSHSDEVNTVAFAANGQILASGSRDQTIKLWDGVTGMLINTLHGHSGAVNSVAFTPDGRYLASGSADESVVVWDVSAAIPITTLNGHSDSVWCVSFTPDGRLLASGSVDKTIRLWDCATGAHRSTLEGHLAAIGSLTFTPDGKYLASQSQDGDRRLWDVVEASRVPTSSMRSEQINTPLLSDTIPAPFSSLPLQLVKKNDFHVVLMTSSQSLHSTQIPICLLPSGSQVWDAVSTPTHLVVAMRNGELFLLDASQVKLD